MNYVKYDGSHIHFGTEKYDVNNVPKYRIDNSNAVFKYKPIPIPNLDWSLQVNLCEIGCDEVDKERQIMCTLEKFRIFIKCVCELTNFAIPVDIWNRIAYAMYEFNVYNVPYVWEHNHMRWYNWWLCNTLQQDYLPITHCDKPGTEILLQVISGSERLFTSSVIQSSNDTTCNIVKNVDIVSGIHFNNISNIKTCRISFSNSETKEDVQEFPFILTNEYSAKCMIVDDKTDTSTRCGDISSFCVINQFYYNPYLKCIPLICAPWTDVVLHIELNDPSTSKPVWSIIGSCLPSDARNKLRSQEEYCFDDAPYKLFGGMLRDKDYRIEDADL